MEQPAATGASKCKLLVSAWLCLLTAQPTLAVAGDVPDPPARPTAEPVTHRVEDRGYFAPSVQFGRDSLELSLSYGSDTLTVLEPPKYAHGNAWLVGRGLRLTGVAHSGSATALHGLAYLWFCGFTAAGPQGLELAVGGGGNSDRLYGLLQLTYLIGVPSRFAIFATVQWPFGEKVERPPWLSQYLFGVRFGFDVWKKRATVTTTPEA